jgi:YidC/Oxa1 family membrane protein insertase
MEKRLLLAFVLSALIFAVWSVLFPPPAPPVAPGPAAQPTVAVEAEGADERPEDVPGTVSPEPADEPIAEAVSAEAEETIELANELLSVELSNRGAVISALRLLEYDDDEGEVLDLVQTVPLASRALPLQLLTNEGPDTRLYRVEKDGSAVRFSWSDGAGNAVNKTVELGSRYDISIKVERSGELADAAVSVGTGLRDLGEQEQNSRLAVWGDGVILADGEFEKLKKGKVKAPMVLRPGNLGYAGLEDAYFINLMRPSSRVEEVLVERFEFQRPGAEDEDQIHQVLRVALRPAPGAFEAEILAAPKEYKLLQSIGGGVEKTLDFGIFGVISVFFLKALWWIYGQVGNYGVAIILLTVGIRIVLFPLMHTSTVSMRKMAKIQPKVKEIQNKYKKKKNDPQARAKMSQETMALYKAEGVNPMAGCLPLFVQLPILWALYQLFLHAIELRHAPFYLWIQDLSAKDPYYVTPILMTATMWLQQKLAPQAGDPQQQRIMRMLPLVFGIMFLQFPSGLVLYWLTNNVITILQQEITLHMVGERKLGGFGGRRKSK